jgi:hypothetical protein
MVQALAEPAIRQSHRAWPPALLELRGAQSVLSILADAPARHAPPALHAIYEAPRRASLSGSTNCEPAYGFRTVHQVQILGTMK